ncbi:glutathione S-transferase family protein [Fodinicurvata sp. EGI_FJ10296]|uniref:glutathione S-transferase family protein n=1 Tax=Fodinicurvata sp. EGI_FJ10296 TaxID=3231908 RepID=UPI003452C79F
MGLLIEGEWHDKWYDTDKTGGHFKREESAFRSWVTADGFAGPTGDGGFQAEAGRYHLYVSLACPWAHRTLIFRALKGLEDAIGVSVVDPYMGSNGWQFGIDNEGGKPSEGVVPDSVNGVERLRDLYVKANPTYTGRVTVPTLWDKKRQTIVSNESADIIRMLNTAFDAIATRRQPDMYPEPKRGEIDEINALVYDRINNGVYKSGFATTSAAYETNVTKLFYALDTVEQRLATRRYLTGDTYTEADWRLFTTLVRFDPVYVGHFKCNLRRIVDYPNLWGYTRDLFQVPGVAGTVDLTHIKRHYYESHPMINPTRIVPKGPVIDFAAPHGRESIQR